MHQTMPQQMKPDAIRTLPPDAVQRAGSGDTPRSGINAAGMTAHFPYVWTAVGAFLAWLEGRNPLGISAFTQDKKV